MFSLEQHARPAPAFGGLFPPAQGVIPAMPLPSVLRPPADLQKGTPTP